MIWKKAGKSNLACLLPYNLKPTETMKSTYKYGKSGTLIRHSNWNGASNPTVLRAYSNGTVVDTGNVFTEIPGSDDYSDINGGPSSGSSVNWNSIANMFSTLGSAVSSIWGKGDKYVAQAYQTMYKEQQRTNTILWVVIGLVLALGVFLLVRKH